MKIGLNLAITIILFLVALKLFMVHREKEYEGHYQYSGAYEPISLTKHDMTKYPFVLLFMMLMTNLTVPTVWWDSKNVFESAIGVVVSCGMGFFVYNELVQPYIIYYLPPW